MDAGHSAEQIDTVKRAKRPRIRLAGFPEMRFLLPRGRGWITDARRLEGQFPKRCDIAPAPYDPQLRRAL